MQRILFPEWRKENETTKYPFADDATLSNGVQSLVEGTLLDAILYPIGGGPGMFLSQVTVGFDQVTIWIGTTDNKLLASGSFPTLEPPGDVPLLDAYGRPAGLLVSESVRLGLFASWGIGTFVFKAAQTGFTATVCVPQPADSVRGVLLDDGTLMTGDFWLIGDDGVVLRHEVVLAPSPQGACGPTIAYEVIRVDVVGDPLFKRRLCLPHSLFQTPNFIKTVTFQDSKQRIVCTPNGFGDIKMTINNAEAPQPHYEYTQRRAATKLRWWAACCNAKE